MRKEREEQYIERIERCLTDQVDQSRDSSSKVIVKGNLSLDQQKLLRTYYMALRTGNTVTKSSKKARSYATFYEYIRHLRRFGVYINKEYLEANLSDAEGFIERYSSCSQSVLNSIAKTLKCFYAWLAKREKLDFNEIVETLENMKFDKCMIERLDQNKLLDDSDILKLINSADLARDKALISILAESGCRVGELIDLNVGNISFDSSDFRTKLIGTNVGNRKVDPTVNTNNPNTLIGKTILLLSVARPYSPGPFRLMSMPNFTSALNTL